MRNTLRDINVHSLPRIIKNSTQEALVNLYLEAYTCENDTLSPKWLRKKAECVRLYFDHMASMSDYYNEKEQQYPCN